MSLYTGEQLRSYMERTKPRYSASLKAIADHFAMVWTGQPSTFQVGDEMKVTTWAHKFFSRIGAALSNPYVQFGMALLGGIGVSRLRVFQGFIGRTKLAALGGIATGVGYVAPEGSFLKRLGYGFGIGIGAGALTQSSFLRGAVQLGTVAGAQPWYTWVPIIGPTLNVLTGSGYGPRDLSPMTF